jgi:predicted nucleic acid-binding Zn ribbon protein
MCNHRNVGPLGISAQLRCQHCGRFIALVEGEAVVSEECRERSLKLREQIRRAVIDYRESEGMTGRAWDARNGRDD